MENVSPIELLWNAICIKFEAIIRAQKIMYVKDTCDTTKELKRIKNGDSVDEKEYEIQFAWDKQATFLVAQSRAMGTLNSMIKQYEELCRQDGLDEEQSLRMAKLKAEVDALQKDDTENVDVPDEEEHIHKE